MAARAFMEQVRTVMLQRRVRETQSRSEPAGAFQSLIAHIIHRDNRNLPKTGRFHPRLSPLNSRFEPKQGMLQAAIMLHGGIAGGLITDGPLLPGTHGERASSALGGRSYET
jgi:hypothetical protein